MAFVLTTPAYDYGDAPDPKYPTLLANNGARHIYWPNGPFMGMGVDTEPDGQPGPLALGDDNNATDDEDGVTIHGPWVIGQTARFSVDMRSSPADCNLNAWVDFNANGSWDAGEQIAADVPLSAGIHTYPGLRSSRPPDGDARNHLRPLPLQLAGGTGSGRRGAGRRGGGLPRELLAPPKPPVRDHQRRQPHDAAAELAEGDA